LRCLLLLVIAAAVIAAGPVAPTLRGGTGTIYLASYAKRIAVIDEATEKVSAEIPLKTGLPWAMRPSRDGSVLFVQSADQEHFEIVDVKRRQTVDTFMLGDATTHVRALAFEVDPSQRFMVLVVRTARKLVDRFEIETPAFIQYDLKEHKILRTVPWSSDPEPRYYSLNLRFSPDGKLLYVFSNRILICDASTLQQIDSWDLSLPTQSGFSGLNMGSLDETNDRPGYFTALFTFEDRLEKRRMLGVGRVNLSQKSIDYFPIGPQPDHGEISFALGADHDHGYVLVENIGRNELWTIDIPTRRLESRTEFAGRTRMAIRSSSNGKILYIYEAGNTIDLYQADGFKYLRTMTFDADMMYGTFYVFGPA
jgi:DNA-binding beta-propeller fold protein YncE